MTVRGTAARQARGTRGPGRRTDSRRPGGPPPPPPRGDVRRWFAQALLDTLAGRRSATTLMRVTSTDVYQLLWTLAEAGALRPGPRGRTPELLAYRHSEPVPGVLEVAAVVHAAGRSRALAFRLEQGRDRRWRCTALETR